MAMGYGYKEEKPFEFYDPEQVEWEGHRAPPPLYRPAAPVSPQVPISPRAVPPPPGLYPEPDLRYSSRAGVPGSPQERPFEYYNPKATMEGPRQGMGSQFGPQVPPGVRPLDAEPGYGMDNRGIGRGVPPPPYVSRDADHLPMPRGASPNVSYGRGAPVEPGYVGRGRERDGDGHYDDPAYFDADGRRPGYESRSPRREMPGRHEDLAYVDANGKRRESGYPRGRGGGDRYEDPAYYDAHGTTKPRYGDGESHSPRPGRYEDPTYYDTHGRKPGYGDEDSDYRRPPLPVEPGRGVPERGRDGRGYGDPAYERRPGDRDPGYERRPGDRDPGYERRPGDRDPAYERRPGDREPAYERRPGDREPAYERRPGDPAYERRAGDRDPAYERRPGDRDPAYERRPGDPAYERRAGDRDPAYERRAGDRDPAYERRAGDGYGMAGPMGRGGGRDSALGDGRYAYGGLRPLQRLDSADVEEDGAPPAPISSEYAHQVYATVFTDPVYGGAGYVNTRVGYHEEPESVELAHRREDLLRHPEQF